MTGFWRAFFLAATSAVVGAHVSIAIAGALVEPKAEAVIPNTTTSQTATTAKTASNAHLSDFILLHVDKERMQADLRTWPEVGGTSSILSTFRIAIGKEEGDKEREGDNKTPEGIYFTRDGIDGKSLPIKYGPRAIPIDFPNPIDQFNRKTGHGIWLHGVEADTRVEQAKVTEGCVAFYNADIQRLGNWMRPFQSLVVISQGSSHVNEPQDLSAVLQRTRAWADAWSNRQLEEYMAYYSPAFNHEGKNLAAWNEYKKKVFQSYHKMLVSFDQIRIVTHPKYALSVMNQDFRGDSRFVSVGRKLLYWQRGADGQWYVTREVFGPQKIEPHRFSESEMATISNSGTNVTAKQENNSPNL